MSYYSPPMGDYKTYGYAGDPGFLSSLWKGVKSIALPVLGGLIAGPAGVAAVTAASGKPGAQQPFQLPGTIGGAVSFPGGMSVSGAFQPQGRLPPYTAAGAGVLPRGGARMRPRVMPMNGMCPTGYHFVKSGEGYCVRNRRMNVANPRALRRGMRRVQGFEKLARRTISFTRRVKMKKRKSS